MRVIVVEHIYYTVTGYDRDLMPIAERGESYIEVFGSWEKAEDYVIENLTRKEKFIITQYYAIDSLGRTQKVLSNEEHNMTELQIDRFEQYVLSDLEVEI